MKTYTIKAKMSNTGTIHDIASDMHDRVINFRGDTQYAVVLAAYYGGKGYTTHVSEGAAAKKALSLKGYSYEIIGTKGKQYTAYNDQLIPEDY